MGNDEAEWEEGEPVIAPLGYHLARRSFERLPRHLPPPSCIRVREDGLVLDNWLIGFSLSKSQMCWLIDMVQLWFLLDDSAENGQWLCGVLDAMENGYVRYCGTRDHDQS